MKDKIRLSANGEHARVLSLLRKYERGELHDEGESLEALPLMCKTVIEIRQLNRRLLDKIAERSWTSFDKKHPESGDEILIRIDDASGIHVELVEWTEEDEEFFYGTADEDLVWMKLPGLK